MQLQLHLPTRVYDLNMPQQYIIDDVPRTKSPKPATMQKRKPVSPDSPDRKREKKIEEARDSKYKARAILFEPQSSKESQPAPLATKVLVGSTSSAESLQRLVGESATPLVTPEEKRWAHFMRAKYNLSKIQGMKQDELNSILREHFPDCMIEPQGLMDVLGLSMDPVLMESASRSVDTLNESLRGLQNIKHTIDITDKASDAIEQLGSGFEKLNTILLLVAVVIIMRPTTAREKILVGFIVVGFVATKTDLMSIWQDSSLCAWLKAPVVEIEPQSFSVDSMSTMIVGLMNSYVFFGAGKSLMDPFKLSKVIQSISRTDMAVGSMIKTVHLLTSFVHSCIDHYWNGNPWFLASGHAFIDEFLKESGSIIMLHEERKLLDLQSSLDRVRAAITLGENVSMKIPGSSDTVGLRMQVNNTLAALRNIKKLLLASNFQNAGLRQEPASLLLRGAPGVGKSQAMQHIAHAMNALTLSDEDFSIYEQNPAYQIHTRAAENIYWDGYKQSQNIVFMDDLLQPRDIAGSPDNEVMNTIRIVNIFEYPLHCAEITSKGNTTFRSNFLIGNTNAHNFNCIQSINEVGAFIRRWHLIVDVVPRDEFCVDPSLPLWQRRFDTSKLSVITEEDIGTNYKLSHLIGHTKITPDMCNYHVQRMCPDERGVFDTGEILDFKGLVLRYHEAYVERKIRQEVYLKGLDQTLKEYREMRNPIVTDEEIEVSMEDVEYEPQSLNQETIAMMRPTEDFEWITHLGVRSRRIINQMRLDSTTDFGKIDATMKYLFFQSETLGGMMFLQDAFDATHEFYGKHGYESADLFPIFGSDSWVSFFDSLSAQIYVMTISPKTLGYSQQTRQLLNGISLQRGFIEENKAAWAVAPTWISYLHRMYSYTLSHALAFGRRITFDPLGSIRVVANYIGSFEVSHLFYGHLLQFGSMVAAFKVITMVMPFLFPVPQSRKSKPNIVKRMQIEAQVSNDPVVIKALEDFEKAKADMAQAETDFKKNVGHIMLKFEKDDDDYNEPESDERHNRIHKVKRQVKRPPKPRSNVTVEPQSLTKHNAQMMDIQSKIRARNVFQFLTPVAKSNKSGSETHSVSGYALAVKGRCILFPYHFLSVLNTYVEEGEIQTTDLVVLRRTLGLYDMLKVQVGEILDAYLPFSPGQDKDLVMIELPKRFQPVPDITKFIATLDETMNLKKFDAILSIPSPTNAEVHTVVAEYGGTQMIGVGTDFEPYSVKSIFKYQSQTSAGDCGSLLFVNDKTTSRCLIGIHIAGAASLKIGMSSVIFKEFIDQYYEFLSPITIDPPIHMALEDLSIATPNMYCVGKIPDCKPYPRSIGKSKIIPSHIAGLAFPVTRFPARLRPFYKPDGERIDPNEMALRKYCQPDVYIDETLLKIAVDDLCESLVRNSKVFVSPEVYSYENAVLGDSSGFWTAVPRSTSSGYPWNCMPGSSSKTRFWGTDMDYDLTTAEAMELEQRVESVIQKAKKGVRSAHYFTDSLKDERRSIAKVTAGVTRLISCCPVDLLIAFRMYFGAFQKWLVANRIENGYAIGVNEHSSEWDIIATKLDKFGDHENKEDGDQAGFDTNHRNAMSLAVFAVVSSFYGDKDREANLVREVLWQEVVNSVHLNEGYVYEWFTALPSGAPPTTFFNCTANQLLMRAAWYGKTRTMKPQPLFDDHVYLIVLGDDNLYCCDPGFTNIYNGQSVASGVAHLGYVYTPADKGLHKWSMKSLSKSSFLKRGFRFDREFGRYVAPLDLASIMDMVNWQKESSNSYADCEAIISTALDELVYHGKELYNQYSAQLLGAIARVPELTPPRALSYHMRVSILKHREEKPELANLDGFFSGYDYFHDTFSDQMEVRRLEEERGLLFSGTVRTPRWQPHSSPGFGENSTRLVHRVVLKRTATHTNKEGNSITDQAAPGLTDQGVFETSRMMMEKSDQSSDTTKSTVDAETPITRIVNYRPLHPSLLDSARSGVSQDIAAFLAKPIAVASGSFGTSDTYATFNWVSNGIPQSLLYAQPLWSNKVAGNYAFKGTLHLSVQTNATRFQQGRYILGWIPSGGGDNFDKWRRFHTASLTLATQVPHVEIDLNCDTEATIIIPHITAQGWASLNFATPSYVGNNGCVFLTAYEPLAVATGSTSCNYNIFAHWTDVEVAMPIQPQSGRVKTRIRRKVRSIEAVEQSSSDIGPLSSGFLSLAKASSALSGIPFLSSVAAPASWALEVASKIASSFGWSRPHNAEQPSIIQRFIVPRLTNSDVADNSTVLGGMDSNGIETLSGFAGSDLDEMSLSYLTSISAFCEKVTWTSAGAQNTQLYFRPLAPRINYTSNAVAGVTNFSLSPISYFSSFFSLYRGSIKMIVKLVKTEFHSGRLLVVFKPYDIAVGTMPSTAIGTAYEHREILDIREGNEFTLEFPYMSTTPYRSTTGAESYYGSVQIYILNTLEAPPNVAQDITLLVEIAAGKDFELAVPTDASGVPTQIYTPQMGTNVCEIVSEDIGNSVDHETDVPARLCIGERFLSIRQMLKRFSYLGIGTAVQQSSNVFLEWLVWRTDMSFSDTNGLAGTILAPDTYAWMQPCFALQRGGLRVKVVPTTSDAARSFAGLVPFRYNAVLPLNSITWAATAALMTPNLFGAIKPVAVQALEVSGGVELQVPYYSRTQAAACCDLIGTTTAAVEGFDYQPGGPVPRTKVVVNFPTYTTTTPKPWLFRAVSEDFSFGLFVSTPLLTGWSADYVG